jgi:hypothetical protein
MPTNPEPAPSLVALVYRSAHGCRQYPFYTIAELERWASRKPYCVELLRVMVVKDMKTIADDYVLAHQAAAFVRDTLKGA